MTQPTLFDNELPPEPERSRSEKPFLLARVVFSDGAPGVFDYRISPSLAEKVQPGCRLQVPLGRGNRLTEGWCIQVHSSADLPATGKKAIRYKEIAALLDLQPLLNEKQLELARWITKRYLAPMGQVLEAILPAAVRNGAGTRLTTVWSLAPNAGALIQSLYKRAREVAQQETQKNPSQVVQPKDPLTSKQKSILNVLKKSTEGMTLQELARAGKCSAAPIQTLRQLGLLTSSKVRRESEIFNAVQVVVPRRAPHALNPEQQNILDQILNASHRGEFQTFLLHGVTGSGKTEVYIRAIDDVVRCGKQAIVLVPEISLTPQTVLRFRERFDSIAVLHSHLTDSERNVEWSRIRSGQVQVVVGARSAIFAPLDRLGLIVIDEEHENSFKQDTSPRYHAREVARFRAWQEKIPLILGSATPALESWYRQLTGQYRLLSLPNRVNQLPMPSVELVDLRHKPASEAYSAIHRRLYQALTDTLAAGNQAILFLNRRGYSTQIQCPVCGEAVLCPNCDIALTHHRSDQIALCHYCDYQISVPKRCPSCGSEKILFTGLGTQKLEAELARRFPGTSILRMDSDTMVGHGAYERALNAFGKGEYQILLGTQMIAKGLDFPNVTLVGVINADSALYHVDFRSAERTFHLITQVAGRTGRGQKGGRVIVQTYTPEHRAIQAAARHSYEKFVGGEFPERKKLGYPPFGEMIRFVIRGPDEEQTNQFASELAQRLRLLLGEEKKRHSEFAYRVLGPAPAPFAKLRGNYRFHIHLHSPDGDRLRNTVRVLMQEKIKAPQDLQWMVDVDPLDTL